MLSWGHYCHVDAPGFPNVITVTPSEVSSQCFACRPSCANMQPQWQNLPSSHDLAHPPLLLLTDFIYFLLFSSPGRRRPLLPWFQLKQELVWGCRVMFVLHHVKHPFTRPPPFNVPVSHPFVYDGNDRYLFCHFGWLVVRLYKADARMRKYCSRLTWSQLSSTSLWNWLWPNRNYKGQRNHGEYATYLPFSAHLVWFMQNFHSAI